MVRLFPKKEIKSLEDFFISRFGKELYETFFKDYTEKVWGVPCTEISASWGAQRIKKLSISRTILHAIKSNFIKNTTIEQKNTDTSLIEQFMYPKLGPGLMWETVTKIIEEKGGVIIRDANVVNLNIANNNVEEVGYYNHESNSIATL